MDNIATLLQIIAALAVVTSPVTLIVLLIAGTRRVDLALPFVLPGPLPWPKGVQEEDCPRWDVTRLGELQRRDPEIASCPPNGRLATARR